MNSRYRKQMRIRSRHYRRGHTLLCRCWEPWQHCALEIGRYIASGRQLAWRTAHLIKEQQP